MEKKYSEQLEQIDEQIVKLFHERMTVAEQIANVKKANGLPVIDKSRERAKLQQVADASDDSLKDYIRLLYSNMFELSRSYQRRHNEDTELTKNIKYAIDHSPKMLPSGALVACQGVEGAYSQQACDKLFENARIMFFKSFDAVFTAVEKGLCQYGVIPLENSTAGSVNAVYDHMIDHNFSIVRSTRLKIDHNLLVKPGVKLEEITEIYSHQQAISQCAGFLSNFKDVKIIPCENTAIAAQKVASSPERGIACLSSRDCIKFYGLEALKHSVQDKGNNYTRFICISKDLEILPGADRTSLMAILPHEAGSLYNVLARLNALGINMNKLESRPIPDRDFEFMFYFDLVSSVYSDKLIQLITELDEVCESFHYLGSYSEVI